MCAESVSESVWQALDEAVRDGQLSESARDRIKQWLTDPQYQRYRQTLIQHINDKQFRLLDDLFWTVMPFGTGGRRGRMYPIGTNAMNERTVGESAQGLAEYLYDVYGRGATLTAVVAHDTRNNSRRFAEHTASVLAANGIRTFLFPEHRATPELSFAVRYLGASTGVVISASHNPPSDNGFKCYWRGGGQVVPPHDVGILERVAAVREVRDMPVSEAQARGLVEQLDERIDREYVDAVVRQAVCDARAVRIAYTPLHGVGLTSVLPVLQAAGFNDIHLVESQCTADGNFPAVANNIPNPEVDAAMAEVIQLADRVGADIALASDPDADRVGVAVRTPQGWQRLSGNQVAALLTWHVLDCLADSSDLSDGYVVKTYVTTDMMRAIAQAFKVRVVGDLPVGFKWIAQTIDQEPGTFLFGAEESLGYLRGTYARDKDGAVGALLVAEAAARAKQQGKDLAAVLDELYARFGYFHESADSRTLPGREGVERMRALMARLRSDPPTRLGPFSVRRLWDFRNHEVRDLVTGRSEPVERPDADMVALELDRPGWRVVARPSGTEPKIKFYFFGHVPSEQLVALGGPAAARQQCHSDVTRIREDLTRLIDEIARS